MPITVQKFGGTSVANAERIMAAARRAIQAKKAGNQVVMVVSARGDTTDELVAMAEEITEHPPAREMDMLLSTGEQISIALMAMAIQSMGEPAVSMTGAQVGIVTDAYHTKARIKSISTDRILDALNAGKVVIVAGFQGTDDSANITTLGRGGSDTTAVALAAACDADVCEIYTDVDGIYTTDPRKVPGARKIDAVSYDEMLELASAGAGVMHSRSIEFAKKFDVPIHVRSSLSDSEGTWIIPKITDNEQPVVCGAALVMDEARITVSEIPQDPAAIYEIFANIAEHNIVVDMIVQNVAKDGPAEVSFTVLQNELHEAVTVTSNVVQKLGAGNVHFEDNVSKVSVVGAGMRVHSGVADRMFAALAEAGVNIKMITTSEIKISVLVERDRAVDALRAVHDSFALDQPGSAATHEFPRKPQPGTSAEQHVESLAAIVQGLPAMESIVVSEVAPDEDQARITVFNVPDQPGIAAKIFARIAEVGAVVDMIVQNIEIERMAHVSFTVRPAAREAAEAQAGLVAKEVGGEVASDSEIAKITVMGVGMRTHTGVAAKIFAALSRPKIRVLMINTSEVHITLVVERSQASEAIDCLRRAFELPS